MHFVLRWHNVPDQTNRETEGTCTLSPLHLFEQQGWMMMIEAFVEHFWSPFEPKVPPYHHVEKKCLQGEAEGGGSEVLLKAFCSICSRVAAPTTFLNYKTQCLCYTACRKGHSAREWRPRRRFETIKNSAYVILQVRTKGPPYHHLKTSVCRANQNNDMGRGLGSIFEGIL
jgi:hypothetical protein